MTLLTPGDRVKIESPRGRLESRTATVRAQLSDDDFYDYLVDVDGTENWIGVGVLEHELSLLEPDVIHITPAMRRRGLTTEEAILELWLAREELNRAHVVFRVKVAGVRDSLNALL